MSACGKAGFSHRAVQQRNNLLGAETRIAASAKSWPRARVLKVWSPNPQLQHHSEMDRNVND